MSFYHHEKTLGTTEPKGRSEYAFFSFPFFLPVAVRGETEVFKGGLPNNAFSRAFWRSGQGTFDLFSFSLFSPLFPP